MLCVLAMAVVWASTMQALDISQCIAPLGMESGHIPDRDITASSCYNDGNVAPQNARLNQDIKGGAWCPRNQITTDSTEWLEIDLHFVHVVTGTSVQGRFGNGLGQEYAENYVLEYWRPRLGKWVRYRSSDDQEILTGNVNTYLEKKSTLYPPVWASKIRFIPYSSHRRTVCMRVEVYGCYWAVGIVSYSIPKGDKRSNGIELTDVTYDGQWGDELKGGLGQLVDGVFGGDEIREATKNSAWIGWRNDSRPDLSILFEFDKVREFNTVHIFCNNKFMRDVQVFSEAIISFSIGGRHFQDEPIHFSNIPDNIFEHSRNVSIKLHHRIGRWVRIQLKYSARWILISEVVFDSDVAQGHHSPETQKPDNSEKTSLPPKKIDPVPTTTQDDPFYLAIIIGVLILLVILLAAGVALVVHRHRHRKCFASPVSKTTTTHKRTQESYGGCATSILNNKRALELPPDVKSDEYQEPYQESYHPYAGNVVLEMQEFKDSKSGHFDDYNDTSNYDYAVPELSSVPLLMNRRMAASMPDRIISVANRVQMEARLAEAKALMAHDNGSIRSHASFDNMRVRLERTEVIEFPRHRLRMITKLCEGTFGSVYIAEADGVPEYGGVVTSEKRFVAVRFFCNNNSVNERDEFDRDIGILASLSCPYISRVLGMCRSPPFAVVMEYLDHGDLCSFLRTSAPPSPAMLLHIAEQIAAGMEYLETLNFVHRDLAARNCIIGSGYQVKVSDFGTDNELFACDYQEVIGRVPLPLRWSAWETVLNGKYSIKSDVWSFGVTMYEIYTLCRRRPYAHLSDDEVLENLTRMAEDQSLFEYLPRCAAPRDVYSMMLDCWRRLDADRPTFADIHIYLLRKMDAGHYPS